MTEKKKHSQLVLAISGVKNSGKTTLITRILPELKNHGLQVAVIKHDGHDFEADIPGTDTWKMAEAGACGTLVFSEKKYMLVKYVPAPSAEILFQAFPEADDILLEGFKYSEYPKLELIRKENSCRPVCDPVSLCGIVTDMTREELQEQRKQAAWISGMLLFDFEDIAKITDWIYKRWKEQK